MAQDDPSNQLDKPQNALEADDDRGGTAHRRSRKVGDVPERVGQRYFVEERGLRREQRMFENPHDDAPTIRDLGNRLITIGESIATVRDLLDIAAHRQWDTVKVSGSDRFRRMVIQEARDRGIDVEGAQGPVRNPTKTDRSAPALEVETPARRPSADFRRGVRGVVLESGEAVFEGQPGRRPSPFVDIRLADGRVRRAWGAGIPAALDRENISVGDEILLKQGETVRGDRKRSRREWSAERLDRDQGAPTRSPGHATAPEKERLSLGERFRRASPRERAEDKDLRAAQSQLVAAKLLAAAYFAHNPAAASLVTGRLQAAIAASLDKGQRFRMARTRPGADGQLELAIDPGREKSGGSRSAKTLSKHPEITKVRDRGRRR